MPFLHNIRTVAKFEAKILRRSWFFRLFSIGALVILTFMNIGIFSPIGDEEWEFVSIPSSLPLLDLYLLNIGQAIVVIFLASDFLKRDKKVDTNEVLYTRSMSNFEYIMGKSLGILRLFIGLDIIILLIALLINIISKSMTIDLSSYFAYLLIICVPTIMFSLGLAFMLMSVIRNQAITFLLLLGIAALNMFWLYYRVGSIFDYMAFGLPVFKSGVIGFDNLSEILNQRLIYFFLGLSLVLSTVLLFKRLPQSKSQSSFAALLMVIFLAGSLVCAFNTYTFYNKDINEKKQVIDANREFESGNFVSLKDASIEFLQNKNTFDASAELDFVNNNKEPLGKYLFSLNPFLKVTRINSGGKDLNFKRTNSIIEIDPGNPLLPGQSDSINISYTGSIDESFCYPNYSDNIKENPYRISNMLNVNKRQAFLTEEYVLLTPESHWYPVPGLNFYPSNPATIKIDFTNYTLRVKTRSGFTPVSQGTMKTENGYSVFYPQSPLTGLTLAIGNYKSDTLTVDSVNYITYYFPGHDYYKKDLSEIKDTLGILVSGIMRELETSFSTKYPFKTLSLVEVPVQFFSYPKMSTQTRAELQPSMVLLPEKLSTLSNIAGFRKRFTRQKKRMARNNQVITDKELQVRLFNDFVRNTFISGENFRFVNGVALNEPIRYRLGPSFYFFKNNFYSSEFPVINAVFESHLQKQVVPQTGYRAFSGELSENDRANLILKNASFKDVLAKNPGGDTVRAVLTVKGDYLFNLFRSKAGIDEFKNWFPKYIDDHKFQSVDIESLNRDMKEKFGFEFYPYLSDWFNRKEQPGFLFSNLQVSELVVNERLRYQVSFIASNPEPVAGLFNVSVRTAGEQGGGSRIDVIQQGSSGRSITISQQGRGMEASDISRIIFLGPMESKKISIINDSQPRALLINALFAKNIPGEINLPIDVIAKTKSGTIELKDEETLASARNLNDPSEKIVDNEDPGFYFSKQNTDSPLKRLLGIHNNNGQTYEQISMFRAPEYWQPVVQSSFYGKYVRSSVYTRSGAGDKIITWWTIISKSGFYDIYTYIGKTSEGTATSRSGPPPPPPPPGSDSKGNSNPCKDFHYIIYHDQGKDEITLDYENAGDGWNNLGRYYLSSDTAKVEMTNKSIGTYVIGDAVKWVKAN